MSDIRSGKEPNMYTDLSLDELHFILFYLNSIYNGIDNSDKKCFYQQRIYYVESLIRQISEQVDM